MAAAAAVAAAVAAVRRKKHHQTGATPPHRLLRPERTERARSHLRAVAPVGAPRCPSLPQSHRPGVAQSRPCHHHHPSTGHYRGHQHRHQHRHHSSPPPQSHATGVVRADPAEAAGRRGWAPRLHRNPPGMARGRPRDQAPSLPLGATRWRPAGGLRHRGRLRPWMRYRQHPLGAPRWKMLSDEMECCAVAGP